MSLARSVILRAGAVVIALAAGALVAEIIIRVWNPIEIHQVRGLNATFCEHDPILGWRLKPNAAGRFAREDFDVFVSNNSLGFRDREYEQRKPAGTWRVAILGDSMTWGLGVANDSCYSEVLERALAAPADASAGARVEVLNFGAAGYGTDQEYLLFRDVVRPFEPDVVVIAYNANDVINNSASSQHGYHKPYFKPGRNGGISLQGVPVPMREDWSSPWKTSPLGKWLLARSALYTFVRVRLDFLFVRFGGGSVFGKAGGYKLELGGRDPEITTRALMDSLFVSARDAGAEPVLLITVPPGFQRKKDAFQPVLVAHAGARGVRVLDLAPQFRAALETGPLFWPHEGHWTPLGHRVAGETLARFLTQERLLGPAATTAPANAPEATTTTDG